MLMADIYRLDKVEYIVIDTALVAMEREGFAGLASYRSGVGADRILLVDKSLGQVIAAVDSKGSYELLSLDDYRVAHVALGKAEKPAEMHYTELHITEYFLKKLLPAEERMKIAG